MSTVAQISDFTNTWRNPSRRGSVVSVMLVVSHANANFALHATPPIIWYSLHQELLSNPSVNQSLTAELVITSPLRRTVQLALTSVSPALLPILTILTIPSLALNARQVTNSVLQENALSTSDQTAR